MVMDIRTRLRAALLTEGAHKANKYGCVMIFLDVEKKKWVEMQDVIEKADLYEPNGEKGYGKETEPHVTILYGLHKEVTDEEIKAEVDKIKDPQIKLGKVSAFTNEKFDVLKYDVQSEDLHKLNKKFTKFPYTSDYPDYHPHCTIAYVKPGTSEKYIKKLNDLDDIKTSTEKIVYSKANGEKINYELDK